MDEALEKLKDEIENQTSSKIIKQIKVTPIFFEYMVKSVGVYGTFGKNVDISFLGCPIIIDEKLEKHFEIEYIEKGGWNDLNAFITLYLMLEGAKDEQGNRICPLCRQSKLDEHRFLLCEKCEKDIMQKFKC